MQHTCLHVDLLSDRIMLSESILQKILNISYMSYISYSTENWIVSGGEAERESTFGIKYSA